MSSRVVKSAVAQLSAADPVVLGNPDPRDGRPEPAEEALQVAERLRRLAAEELEAARRQANEVLVKAKAEARGLVEAARREIERDRQAARHQAWEEGFQEGREEGLRRAQAEYEERMKGLEALRLEVEAERKRLAEITEAHVAEVAVAVAQRVVRGLVEVDRSFVHAVAEEAVASLLPAEDVVVRVYPGDVAKLDAGRLGYGDGGVKIVADARLGPGDVVVSSSGGEIDARVDTALEEAAALIRARARQAG